MSMSTCGKCGHDLREGFAPARRGGYSSYSFCANCATNRARDAQAWREANSEKYAAWVAANHTDGESGKEEHNHD